LKFSSQLNREARIRIEIQCVFLRKGLNRSAVGKTEISFTIRRPQQLTSPTLTSLLACTNALRRAILRRGYACRRAWPLFHFAAVQNSSQKRLLSIYTIYIKAKAVPIAASSSELASARPTGPELRPRSATALRIQLSAENAADEWHDGVSRISGVRASRETSIARRFCEAGFAGLPGGLSAGPGLSR